MYVLQEKFFRAAKVAKSPGVILTLVLILVVDAIALSDESTVGEVVDKLLLPTHGRGCGSWNGYAGSIFAKDEGFVFIPSYEPDPRHGQGVAFVSCWPEPYRGGWWALTSARWNPKLMIFSDGAVRSATETANIHCAVADHIRRYGRPVDAQFAEWVRAQSGPVQRPIVPGFVHNAVSATVAILLCISLIAFAKQRVNHGCAQRAMKQGLCPTCAYDLRYTGCLNCPECGWRRDAGESVVPAPGKPGAM